MRTAPGEAGICCISGTAITACSQGACRRLACRPASSLTDPWPASHCSIACSDNFRLIGGKCVMVRLLGNLLLPLVQPRHWCAHCHCRPRPPLRCLDLCSVQTAAITSTMPRAAMRRAGAPCATRGGPRPPTAAASSARTFATSAMWGRMARCHPCSAWPATTGTRSAGMARPANRATTQTATR